MIKILAAYISTFELFALWYLYSVMVVAGYILRIVGRKGRGYKKAREHY